METPDARSSSRALLLVVVFATLANSPVVSQDSQDPEFTTCPRSAVISLRVGQEEVRVAWTEPEAIDNSGRQVNVTSQHSSGNIFGLGDTTVTYRAVDGTGNVATCTFVFTIVAPYIYGCPDRSIVSDNEPGQDYANVTWIEPRIGDQSETSILRSDHQVGDRFFIGQTTVTYTLTDDGPNTETCQFIIEVKDVESPTFSFCPDNAETRVLSREACDEIVYWPIPTATDNDGQPLITPSHRPGITRFDCGVTTVTYIATDASNNTRECRFNVTVNVGAYENCPKNISSSTSPGSFTGTVSWTPPTILDLQPEWSQSLSHSSDQSFLVGTTNVTYSLTDLDGAAEVCWFLVSITDIEHPYIRCPSDIIVTAVGSAETASVTWAEPFTSDNVLIHQIWSTHRSGDSFPLGTIIVTYTTNDTTGLKASCNFTVTVQDNILSFFTQISDYVLIGNDDKISMEVDTASCLRACIHEGEFFCRSTEFTSAGECRLSQAIARTNQDLKPQSGVTYFEKIGDNTPPVLTNCPHDIRRDTDPKNSFTAIAWLPPSATDDSGGPVSLSSSHQSGQRFYIGRTEVVYTATDESFNQATCSFSVDVTDNENPVIQDCPGSEVAYLHSDVDDASVHVSWEPPRALDNSGMVSLSTTHEPGVSFGAGFTTITYTAIDPSGNQKMCSFRINVIYLQEQNRFPIRLKLPNLAFSDSFLDTNSEQFLDFDATLQSQVADAFQDDNSFLHSTILNISMTDEGGVEILASVGFSTNTSPVSKRDEIEALLLMLDADGFSGSKVETLQVVEQTGTVIDVDVCFTLPCPDGMNCTARDKTCVAYCAHNPFYCLNGGMCYKQASEDLVSCLCSTYTYYGSRCELEDAINEPQLVATVVGGVWAVILLLLFVTFFPIGVRHCRKSRHDHQESAWHLKEPDIFIISDSEDGDDDETGVKFGNKSFPLEPGVIKTNPAFAGDPPSPSGSQSKMVTVANGAILNTDSTRMRSSGDGHSIVASETNQSGEIGLHVISDVSDTVVQGDCDNSGNFDDAARALSERVPPAVEGDGERVTALVHSNEYGSVHFRSPLQGHEVDTSMGDEAEHAQCRLSDGSTNAAMF